MPEQRKPANFPSASVPAKRFVFVLLDRFSLLSFSSALECLRIANRMAARTLYTWQLVGEGGTEVSCSAGTTFQLDADLEELQRDDIDLVDICTPQTLIARSHWRRSATASTSSSRSRSP